MGNELEKQYNIKQKPIKLPGSYAFLKFVEHPSDPTSSLIIIKSPHKAGIISSQILLPIKQIKSLGYSDYTVATCRKCKPLGLVKPRSETQMKLIIKQIIRLSCEMGRIFQCDGRLMLWCEETRSPWFRSPEEIQQGKQSDKSKVFWAGLCLINYLHCVYDKEVKKKKDKDNQIQSFFDPKDKKQYYQFFDKLQFKLSKSSFWTIVSQGMKSLILIMLAKNQNDRIDMNTLMTLPYFASQKQLRLYHMLSEQVLQWQQKQCIIVMQTVEMVIHDRIIFDDLILNEYITPILLFLLQKKPQVIISAIVQLPNPPTRDIAIAVKKANPKNIRLFNAILIKIEKFHSVLNQDEFDVVASRTAFCSFELEFLIEKLIRTIPFFIRHIKTVNFKKQIEFQLLSNIIENKNTQRNILLLGLKCVIQLLQQDLLSHVDKLFTIIFNPHKFISELQINLHILQMYRLMILAIEPHQLIQVMMPKLDLFLSSEQLGDELFLNAKKCSDLIMSKLMKHRNLNVEDQVDIDYDDTFFKVQVPQKPPQSELIAVLKKQALKSKNQDIVWLAEILQNQKPLAEL